MLGLATEHGDSDSPATAQSLGLTWPGLGWKEVAMLGLAAGWGWGLTWGRGGHVRPSGRAWLGNSVYHSCMSRCKLCLLSFFFFY